MADGDVVDDDSRMSIDALDVGELVFGFLVFKWGSSSRDEFSQFLWSIGKSK